MVPALKLGAAGAVIGVVVSEISVGLRGGIGRLVVEFSGNTVTAAVVFVAVFGARGAGPRHGRAGGDARRLPDEESPREIES